MKKEGVIPNAETCPPFATEATAPVLALAVSEILLQPFQSYDLATSHVVDSRVRRPESYPFDLVVPNTAVFVAPKKQDSLSPIVNKALGLASKTSANIGQHYLSELAILQERIGSLALNLVQLEEQSHHLPEFEIHDTETARRVLNLAGYTRDRVQGNGVLLVFRLPKPSSEIWKKITDEASPQEQRSARKSIWAKLGYDAKTQFRENAELYNRGRDIHLRRINRVGHHDPDRFYYLYEITKPNQPTRQTRRRAA